MIAETSYDAAIELAAASYECSRTSLKEFEDRKEMIEIARCLLHKIDEISIINNKEERDKRLEEIKGDGAFLMRSTVCDKNNLDWDAGSIWKNSPRVFMGLMRRSLRKT